jgi:hypothetical protein
MRVLAPVEMTWRRQIFAAEDEMATSLFKEKHVSIMVSDGVEHQAVYDPRLIQGAQEVVSLPLHKHARAILQDALRQVKCGPSSER